MRRRDFITLLGGAAAAWLLAARAQEGARPVAVLSSIGESDQEAQLMVAGLHDGLQALGWVNGRNLRIDHRWAAGSSDRVAALAKELVALSPDVIVAHTHRADWPCKERPIRFRSSSSRSRIPKAAGSWPTSRIQGPTSRASPASRRRWPANGWRCCTKWPPASREPQSSSIQIPPPTSVAIIRPHSRLLRQRSA